MLERRKRRGEGEGTGGRWKYKINTTCYVPKNGRGTRKEEPGIKK